MRYVVTSWHDEDSTTFNEVDTEQPENEQPCIIRSWNTAKVPNAGYLAKDFCRRHNANLGG